MTGVLSKVLRLVCRQTISISTRSSRQCLLPSATDRFQLNDCRTLATSTDRDEHESLPVWSCNEWDPLKEVVVGRAEGQRVPLLSPDLKVQQDFFDFVWMKCELYLFLKSGLVCCFHCSMNNSVVATFVSYYNITRFLSAQVPLLLPLPLTPLSPLITSVLPPHPLHSSFSPPILSSPLSSPGCILVHKYNLQMRPHNLTLPPKDDRNFIARQLYKNIY